MVSFLLILQKASGDVSLKKKKKNWAAGDRLNSWRYISQNCGDPLLLDPLEFLSTLSLQQSINFSSSFSALALVPVLVSACQSLLRSTVTPCICLFLILSTLVCSVSSHLFLMDPITVGDFPICSAFSLLLGQSDDFQAPYTWNLKLDVPSICIIIYYNPFKIDANLISTKYRHFVLFLLFSFGLLLSYILCLYML